jgi:hypothetical protein
MILSDFCGNLQEGCPINMPRSNLFAIPLKKFEGRIKKQEATDIFKNIHRFIP